MTVVSLVAASAVITVPNAAQARAHPTVGSDFNGDGYADLAMSALEYGVSGAVAVVYGSSSGLDAATTQLLSQDTSGVPGVEEWGDDFGSTLAGADFNHDGFDDLAVGVPGETKEATSRRPTDRVNAGVVEVFFGSADGLLTDGVQLISQASPGVRGHSESDDFFGESLETGDLNGDGISDLVIGAVGDTFGRGEGRGVVRVLLGSRKGLVGDGRFLVKGVTYSTWGAVGDRNGDGVDEFATPQGGEAHPVVNVYSQRSQQAKPKSVTALPSWAGTVRYVDFDGDGRADLAAPLGDDNRVAVLRSDGHLAIPRYRTPSENPLKSFSADLNGDGFGDLVVGYENYPSQQEGGVVTVTLGGSAGGGWSGTALYSQETSGIPGSTEDGDQFYVVAAGDFNGDGRAELVIGAPGEKNGAKEFQVRPGSVLILKGTRTGPSTSGVRVITPADLGMLSDSSVGLGFAVA